MIDLFLVKQRLGESLRGYLDRFNLAATEVKDPHEPTVVAALIDGVDKDTEFGRYLPVNHLILENCFTRKQTYAYVRRRYMLTER